jgi:hypothetical protein
MKTDQAKEILEHYREGDKLDSRISQALACLDSNADLADWFDRKRRFDRRMIEAVAEIRVPAGLKSAILTPPRIVPLIPWWRQPVSLAAAAAILLFACGGVFWSLRPEKSFAQYRQAVIDESWGRAPHLDIETSDVGELYMKLARIDPHATVTVPSGLRDLTLHGARTLEWRGNRVILLCFSQGARHMHLFVMNDRTFADMPPQMAPDYEKCSGWKTVSWSQGTRTYVLTGMNYLTFLKKFRHSGHWTMNG